MDSTVCMRNNYYETLGLKPTASDQEIRDGFARAMRLPHLPAGVSEIGIAFDTLSNRAKRRAYDVVLGLESAPYPPMRPLTFSLRSSAQFAGFETASLPQARPTASTVVKRDYEGVSPDLAIPKFLATGLDRKSYALAKKQRVIDWKYPTFALSSAILGVVLIGAWAGAHAEDTQQKALGSTLTVAVPPAKASSDALVAPPSSTSSAEPEFISPALIERAHERIRARASARHVVTSGMPASQAPWNGEDMAQQPKALEAKLLLPNATIVQTIERIGYACGAVASATAVGADQPGAFKVTCTSGQSYQARPLHGRYHFRRW